MQTDLLRGAKGASVGLPWQVKERNRVDCVHQEGIRVPHPLRKKILVTTTLTTEEGATKNHSYEAFCTFTKPPHFLEVTVLLYMP